jgi:hypothetical protein
MPELNEPIDKLLDEVDMLERIYYEPEGENRAHLCLSVAKRVRRYASELIHELAQERDSYSQEAQASDRQR